MSLERHVSRALYVASRVERMIHDDGEWTLSWGGSTVPASRSVTRTSVTFAATIPEMCWLVRPVAESLEIRCDGDLVALQALGDPGDNAFSVTIDFAVDDSHAHV